MNVGEKLKQIPDNTVIHILSLNHWNQIRPYTDLTDNMYDNTYDEFEEFCLQLDTNEDDNYWVFSEKDYYINEGYNLITSDEIISGGVYECW
jgi:hypothetical protein